MCVDDVECDEDDDNDSVDDGDGECDGDDDDDEAFLSLRVHKMYSYHVLVPGWSLSSLCLQLLARYENLRLVLEIGKR